MIAARWAKVKKEEGGAGAEEVLNVPQEPGPMFSVFNHNLPGDNIMRDTEDELVTDTEDELMSKPNKRRPPEGRGKPKRKHALKARPFNNGHQADRESIERFAMHDEILHFSNGVPILRWTWTRLTQHGPLFLWTNSSPEFNLGYEDEHVEWWNELWAKKVEARVKEGKLEAPSAEQSETRRRSNKRGGRYQGDARSTLYRKAAEKKEVVETTNTRDIRTVFATKAVEPVAAEEKVEVAAIEEATVVPPELDVHHQVDLAKKKERNNFTVQPVHRTRIREEIQDIRTEIKKGGAGPKVRLLLKRLDRAGEVSAYIDAFLLLQKESKRFGVTEEGLQYFFVFP